MRWRGFLRLVVPSIAWQTSSTGWVTWCCVDPRLGLVVAVRGMAPLAPPTTTGNSRSFSAVYPVPKHPARVICCIPEAVPEARLTSFSIAMGVVHFIPSARLVDNVGWGLNFVTRTVKGKDKFRTAAPNGRLLRPAGGSLGLFFYRYLDGILLLLLLAVSCHRPFLAGTSAPTAIPTTQASSFRLQYFPYYV